MGAPRQAVRLIDLHIHELGVDEKAEPGRRERAMAIVPWAMTEYLRHGGDFPMWPDVRYEAGAFRVVDGAGCVAAAARAGRVEPVRCHVIPGSAELPAALARRTYTLDEIADVTAAPVLERATEVLCFAEAVSGEHRRLVEQRLGELAAQLRVQRVERFSAVEGPRWPGPRVFVWTAPYVSNPDDPSGLREVRELVDELAQRIPMMVAWNGRSVKQAP